MTWRRNNVGSFILPGNFYNYIDVSGTDTTQWKIRKIPFPRPVHIIYISSLHLACVSWPTIPVCPILIEAFSNGALIHHSEQVDPDVDYSWPQRGRKLHDPDLDHLPWPRSASFAELWYRVDRERQWYIGWMGCILASTEIWDWIYGISGFLVIVSFMR